MLPSIRPRPPRAGSRGGRRQPAGTRVPAGGPGLGLDGIAQAAVTLSRRRSSQSPATAASTSAAPDQRTAVAAGEAVAPPPVDGARPGRHRELRRNRVGSAGHRRPCGAWLHLLGHREIAQGVVVALRQFEAHIGALDVARRLLRAVRGEHVHAGAGGAAVGVSVTVTTAFAGAAVAVSMSATLRLRSIPRMGASFAWARFLPDGRALPGT